MKHFSYFEETNTQWAKAIKDNVADFNDVLKDAVAEAKKRGCIFCARMDPDSLQVEVIIAEAL